MTIHSKNLVNNLQKKKKKRLIIKIKKLKIADFTILTPIHHPNVDPKSRKVCDNFLGGNDWKPETKMREVLEKIYNLFADPDPTLHTENGAEIMEQFVNNKEEWKKEAKRLTKKNAN